MVRTFDGPENIKNIPPWLAKSKIFPPGLIQMLLLLDLLLLLLLLLLLYVFNHVLLRGREAPPYNYFVNQIGGAARLAPPRSHRSTSAFEAIRANLAIPLGMALKTRSKWGCEVSNLLCSAIRNNATIEGTWIFGGWRMCP